MSRMRKVIFTIVAKNYIGLAQVLGNSLKENSASDYFILVADEFDGPEGLPDDLPSNVLIAKTKLPIEKELWEQMAFKYNMIEFCTAIKPFCFEYLFSLGYEKIIFLDPDILVFNSFETVFDLLDIYPIILTPHVVNMQIPYKGQYPEHLFLKNGNFNLGFLALNSSKESKYMLTWLKEKLINQCYFDNDLGMAVDQKWLNMLTCFFEPKTLYVSRDIGLNVAPWNYHERKIQIKEGRFYVTDRTVDDPESYSLLVFVHFSGYDYKSFNLEKVIHKNESLASYEDLNFVYEKYASTLKDGNFSKYIDLPYSYNYFKNKKNILDLHRRIYRRLLGENKKYPNPFETGKETLFELFNRKKIIDHSSSSADKVTHKTMPGFGKKIRKINFVFRSLKSIIGIRRYTMLTRFLKRYFKEENQVFLVDKEVGKKLW